MVQWREKHAEIYLGWPCRVSFDFGKHQITHIERVFFTHFDCFSFCVTKSLRTHKFLTKKKTEVRRVAVFKLRPLHKITLLFYRMMCDFGEVFYFIEVRYKERKKNEYNFAKYTDDKNAQIHESEICEEKKSGTIVSIVYIYVCCYDSRCQLWHMTQPLKKIAMHRKSDPFDTTRKFNWDERIKNTNMNFS